MNVTLALSVIGAFVALIGVPAAVLQARAAIRDGRRQQAEHDDKIRDAGYAAGVAFCQAEIHDLKNRVAQINDDRNRQVAELTDDRNYWRGMNGGGRDVRRGNDDRR